MPGVPGKRTLPWAALLVLLGCQPQVLRAWCSEEDMISTIQQNSDPEFSNAVDFAVRTFNQQTEDKHTYRLEHVLTSSKEKVDFQTVFNMHLQIRKTICWKSEGNIDNCPFVNNPTSNNTMTCYFSIRTQEMAVQLETLEQDCVEGYP